MVASALLSAPLISEEYNEIRIRREFVFPHWLGSDNNIDIAVQLNITTAVVFNNPTEMFLQNILKLAPIHRLARRAELDSKQQ